MPSLRTPERVRGVFFIRLAVGLIFLTQGVLKYTDPHVGVDHFARIGFPHSAFTAHFVRFLEMVCSFLILADRRTRLATVPSFDYHRHCPYHKTP